MADQNLDISYYQTLQLQYLAEAEMMFGPKTDYLLAKPTFHNYPPQTVLYDYDIFEKKSVYIVKLNGVGATSDRKDGIFQISHEVVHLLAPVEQVDGNEVNYLEEGMATFFSRYVTGRETGDYAFCDAAISKQPKYLKALELYYALIEIHPDAVKKIRNQTMVVGSIKPEAFLKADLKVPDYLIEALLAKFY